MATDVNVVQDISGPIVDVVQNSVNHCVVEEVEVEVVLPLEVRI